MLIKSFLKMMNGTIIVEGSCDSTDIKDTLMADRTVKSASIRNFRKYDKRLDDYFVVQGLDIEVEDDN